MVRCPVKAQSFSLALSLALAFGCTQPVAEAPAPNNPASTGNTQTGITPADKPSTQPNDTPVATTPNTVVPNPSPSQPNVPIASPNEPVAPVGPSIRVVGRTFPDDGNGFILNWPGSQIFAGFTGTSLRVTLKELTRHTYGNVGRVNNHFNVAIDGGAPVHLPVLKDGTQTITLATNLAAGSHQVVLTKRTEGQIGSTQFLGFGLSANATLAPATAAKSRRIEFIGDSGTVGYGADGNDPAGDVCVFSAATQNAAQSYAMLTGTALDAEVHITGNSGKGIYQNRDPKNDNVNTLPEMFTWTRADTQLDTGTWNPKSWPADAVVVIVGGNDFAASTPSPTAYAQVANKFVKTLRTAYPNAWLFVSISPLLSGNIESVGRRYAQAMVADAQDNKVAYIDIPTDDGSRNWGCDYHLSPASNAYFASLFAKAIAAKTGWSAPSP